MTNVTATIIITSPKLSLTVRLSPKTAIPKKMAVTGSNAPRMAVGVEPIYWMAPVVQRKDMAGEDSQCKQIGPQIPLVRCVQYAGIEQACHKKR